MLKLFSPWCRTSEEDDPGPTILYSNKRSSCSWRVRIALNMKQIPYKIENVGLEKGDVDPFLDVNPMVHVPALRIDNHTLIGSLNILLYLEESKSGHPLLPTDPVPKARVREICDVIASGIQPLQYRVVLNYIGGEQRNRKWAKHWITRGFKAVEKLLKERAGLFCYNDQVTLADCCLAPQVYNARVYGVDLNQFPTIKRVEANLHNQPAFVAAHPNPPPDYSRMYVTTV